MDKRPRLVIACLRRKNANDPCLLSHRHYPLALALRGRSILQLSGQHIFLAPPSFMILLSHSHCACRFWSRQNKASWVDALRVPLNWSWTTQGVTQGFILLKDPESFDDGERAHAQTWLPVQPQSLNMNSWALKETGLVSIAHSGLTVQQSAVSWGSGKWTTIWGTYEEWSRVIYNSLLGNEKSVGWRAICRENLSCPVVVVIVFFPYSVQIPNPGVNYNDGLYVHLHEVPDLLRVP